MMKWYVLAAFALAGIATGAGQFFLLKKMLVSITAGKTSDVILPFLMKLMLYALVIAVVMLLFSDMLAIVGAGFAGGMVVTAAASFIFGRNRKE